MLDIGQIACFLTIVEQRSFTRAAERLGIAQSAVSQKLLRLEDQLGIRLIDRTSRTLALSQPGKEFLPYAQHMMETEERARAAAQRMLRRSGNTLRLGALHSLVDLRADLIQGYLARAPNSQIEVEFGSRAALLEMLRANTIDACLCLDGAEGPTEGTDAYLCRRSVAYLAAPPDHPLAQRAVVTLADFQNLELVISPGREDSPVLEALARRLATLGALLIRAPEAERRLIAIFAQSRRLPSLRWLPANTPRHAEPGIIIIPIENNAFVYDNRIYFRADHQNESVERFRRFIRDIALPDPA